MLGGNNFCGNGSFVVGYYLDGKLVKLLTQQGDHLYSSPLYMAGREYQPMRLIRKEQFSLVDIDTSLEKRLLSVEDLQKETKNG